MGLHRTRDLYVTKLVYDPSSVLLIQTSLLHSDSESRKHFSKLEKNLLSVSKRTSVLWMSL